MTTFSLPPSDREYILQTVQDSEARHTKRLRMVLDKIEMLESRLDSHEEHVINRGNKNARNVAISAGTLVSVLTGVIGWLLERWM